MQLVLLLSSGDCNYTFLWLAGQAIIYMSRVRSHVISLEPRICVVSPFRVRSRRRVDVFQCCDRRCGCHLQVNGAAAFVETSINLNWVTQPVIESRSDALDSICESPGITVMGSVSVMTNQTFRSNVWYTPFKLMGVIARKDLVGTCDEHASFQAFAGK